MKKNSGDRQNLWGGQGPKDDNFWALFTLCLVKTDQVMGLALNLGAFLLKYRWSRNHVFQFLGSKVL